MLQVTKTEQQESYNMSTNAGENQNKEQSSELLERESIEGTPFIVVGNKDKGYMLTMGRYKFTKYYETKEEAVEVLEKEQWNVILNMIAAAIETQKIID